MTSAMLQEGKHRSMVVAAISHPNHPILHSKEEEFLPCCIAHSILSLSLSLQTLTHPHIQSGHRRTEHAYISRLPWFACTANNGCYSKVRILDGLGFCFHICNSKEDNQNAMQFQVYYSSRDGGKCLNATSRRCCREDKYAYYNCLNDFLSRLLA